MRFGYTGKPPSTSSPPPRPPDTQLTQLGDNQYTPFVPPPSKPPTGPGFRQVEPSYNEAPVRSPQTQLESYTGSAQIQQQLPSVDQVNSAAETILINDIVTAGSVLLVGLFPLVLTPLPFDAGSGLLAGDWEGNSYVAENGARSTPSGWFDAFYKGFIEWAFIP